VRAAHEAVVLDASNTASDVWADSAYRSAEIEEKLAECGLKSRIQDRRVLSLSFQCRGKNSFCRIRR
jgi:IS5 family transposase